MSSGEIVGAVHHVSQAEREQLRIELLSDEAMQTSAIEGEILDRLSVQSSLRRQMGLEPDSYPAKPREQGLAEKMVDLYSGFADPFPPSAELPDPKPNCFMADSDPPLGQKVLNIAQAQAKRKYSHTAYSMISEG